MRTVVVLADMQCPFQHIPLVYDTLFLSDWLRHFWHHFWLVMDTFRPIPFYFSVKVNVWCKWTSYGWLPIGYAVFVHKVKSTVQREIVLWLLKIYWYCSLPCIFANICWLEKFDHQNVFGLLLSVDKYIQYLIKPWKCILSPVPCFLFGKSWLFAVTICFYCTVGLQACYHTLYSQVGKALQ